MSWVSFAVRNECSTLDYSQFLIVVFEAEASSVSRVKSALDSCQMRILRNAP